RLLSFQPGKIVLHNLKLEAERILAHKKLHLTSLGVQLFGCSSPLGRFFLPHEPPNDSFILVNTHKTNANGQCRNIT
ncbi:hypothetical protein, partial [Citrobacter portucalensis]|uniref:hypothetical protein n=1 Tax=Citrobacter portucalensis TaxID=1639133 RepID=UPI00226B254F